MGETGKPNFPSSQVLGWDSDLPNSTYLECHYTGDQAASGPMGFSFVLALRHGQTDSEMEKCAQSGRFIPRASLSSFTMRI